MSSSQEENKTKARVCEQAERYEDMVKVMKELIEGCGKSEEALDEEGRNLLSVAYKNVVGSRRSAWRVISAKLETDMEEKHRKVALEMKERVEEELNKSCEDVLKLLKDHLVPYTNNKEAKIFFLKMRGDYYRYMIEICAAGAPRDDLVKKAESAYGEAFQIATSELPPTSQIRLGLALNYSVFFFEIKESPKEACELAKSEFDAAVNALDDAPDHVYKDSTLILQLLRDNLSLWQSEREEDEQDD